MTIIKTEPNIGNRILAEIIDYGIIFAIIFIFGESNEEGEFALNGALSLIPIIF